MTSFEPEGIKPRRKQKVLVLWAKCKTVAENLKTELEKYFQSDFTFKTIGEDDAGSFSQEVSRKAIEDSDLFLILAAEKDWAVAINTKLEYNYIIFGISKGQIQPNQFSWVKYNNLPTPTYESNDCLKLKFSNGQVLTDSERESFRIWLYREHLVPLKNIDRTFYSRPDSDWLILNQFIKLDRGIWGPTEQGEVQDFDLVDTLKTLKILHSVNKDPGPAIKGLLKTAKGGVLTRSRRQPVFPGDPNEDKAASSKLLSDFREPLRLETSKIRIKQILELSKRAILPFLYCLKRRLYELPEQRESQLFIDDLIRRVILLAEPQSGSPPITKSWVEGFLSCKALIDNPEYSFFVPVETYSEWENGNEIKYLQMLNAASSLHVAVIELTTFIAICYDVLRIHQPTLDRIENPLVVLSAVKYITSLRAASSMLIEDIVNNTNDFILWYLDAANRLGVRK